MTDQFTRTIVYRYLIALGLSSVVCMVMYLIVLDAIRAQQPSADVLDIGGRQSMLSQRIALTALHLVDTRDLLERRKWRQELVNTTGLMESSLKSLVGNDLSLSRPGVLSPEQRAIYFDPLLRLDTQVRTCIAEAKALMETPDAGLSPENPHLLNIMTASTELLAALDIISRRYQEQSSAAAARVQFVANWAPGLLMLLPPIAAVITIWPLLRRTQQELTRTRTLNETLERRLNKGTAVAERRAIELEAGVQVLTNSMNELFDQVRFFQAVLDLMNDGIIITDEQGEVVRYNRAAVDILDIPPTQVPLGEWAERYGLFLADRATPYPAGELPLVRAMHGEIVEAAEVWMCHPSRPKRSWLRMTARPLQAEQHTPQGNVLVLRDITAYKQAEEEFCREREQVETLLQGIHTMGAQDPIAEKAQNRAEILLEELAEAYYWLELNVQAMQFCEAGIEFDWQELARLAREMGYRIESHVGQLREHLGRRLQVESDLQRIQQLLHRLAKSMESLKHTLERSTGVSLVGVKDRNHANLPEM